MVWLLLGRQRLMRVLLCWHGERGCVGVIWPHLLWIPQYSGSELGRMHHHGRRNTLLTVHPNRISAAAAVLLCKQNVMSQSFDYRNLFQGVFLDDSLLDSSISTAGPRRDILPPKNIICQMFNLHRSS